MQDLEKMLDGLEMELEVAVSHHVSAGAQTLIFWKNSIPPALTKCLFQRC